MNASTVKTVTFGDLPIGARFLDHNYSGDWCVKTAPDAARSLEYAYPMNYSIWQSCPVQVETQA